MLTVKNICAGYGPLEVVKAANLEVEDRECVALIGWSGAGKTTLLKAIAGLVVPNGGTIVYRGTDILSLSTCERVLQGIAMVPEGRLLFSGMTVYENILVGAHTVRSKGTLQDRLELVFKLFPELKDRGGQIAGTLSGGEQQMCAIARAMMSLPTLLLIDELSLGLAPVVVDRLVEALAALRDIGTTILVVEQDAQLALNMSNRAYVMQRGQITKSGTSATLHDDSDVQREYFGLGARP
jgi:branched-chain amino acid transport system ATP-binding protein